MCMYCAMACASGPVSIVLPAMAMVGHCLTADAMPAFCASALIADGVMSDPATMYSCERLLLTVFRPFTPITMAATPNAMRTAAATSPPISSVLRMSRLLSEPCGISVYCRLKLRLRRRGNRGVDGGSSSSRLREIPDCEDVASGGGGGLARTETGCDRPRDVERRDDADRTAVGIGHGEVPDAVLRHQAAGLPDRPVSPHADERPDRGRTGGERIEVEPRGRHQVEGGDAGPQPGRRFVPVVCVFEDEDRVHAVGRHHPGHDPERRLGRAADDAAAHRVCDGRGLEPDGQLVPAILCIDHARIVVPDEGTDIGRTTESRPWSTRTRMR